MPGSGALVVSMLSLIPLSHRIARFDWCVLDEDDDQQVDGEDVAWEDDEDRDEDGDEGDGGESPLEFEIEDADEQPEERRVRALRFGTEI